MLLLATLWIVAGALVHLHTIHEDTGPWWATATVVLSWPIFLVSHYTMLHIEVGMVEYEEIDGGE